MVAEVVVVRTRGNVVAQGVLERLAALVVLEPEHDVDARLDAVHMVEDQPLPGGVDVELAPLKRKVLVLVKYQLVAGRLDRHEPDPGLKNGTVELVLRKSLRLLHHHVPLKVHQSLHESKPPVHAEMCV